MENVAFGKQSGPEGVRFYDWQICSRGPVAYDVMYFFSQSVNVADWNSMGRELIEVYYNALTEAGVNNYSMEALRQDMSLAACMMFGFISAVGNIVPPDESGHAVIDATLPRFFNIMSVLDVESTLENFS